ncbi:MAG: glycosyltransferase family 4 protein [Bacteroidota bacterium]
MAPPSFVREDLRIFEEAYDLRTFAFRTGTGVPGKHTTLLSERARLASWLKAELPHVSAAFGWFADYHTSPLAVQARRRGIPSAIVVGGYDAMRIPEHRHGVYASRWRAPLARRAARATSVLLPVADSLVQTRNPFLPLGSQDQGLDVFVPDHAPTHTVPTGYDPDQWAMGPMVRESRVLTVAIIDSAKRVWIKGIDLVVEAARCLPNVRFDIIGVPQGDLSKVGLNPPPNVECHPPVQREALVEAYQQASVYLQLSRVEGMPNVLCEAMLCGAVPVGTDVFGIPAAIGAAGWTVAVPDVSAIVARIQSALAAPSPARHAARDHVATTFPLARRRRTLHTLMDGLMDGQPPEKVLRELA